jgi:hypothetical protein
MGRVAGDEHGVAVRRSARDVRSGSLAARTGDVLDDDGPAESRVELLAENAGERIGRVSGRERHHEPDRTRRIILSGCGCREHGQRTGGQCRDRRVRDLHVFLPALPRVGPRSPFP